MVAVGVALNTCPNCGHVGPDVVWQMEYVGGHGYMPRLHCRNESDCWERWDAKNMTEDKNNAPDVCQHIRGEERNEE